MSEEMSEGEIGYRPSWNELKAYAKSSWDTMVSLNRIWGLPSPRAPYTLPTEAEKK